MYSYAEDDRSHDEVGTGHKTTVVDNTDYEVHPWKVIERAFRPEMQEASESLFSLGNGRMGQRANFEEGYSGPSLLGNYVAGVYYPDKTRVGWWKVGYPEYYSKVPNAANWIGLQPSIEGEPLDLATAKIEDFYRELDMKSGVLTRSFKATLQNGKQIEVEATRFVSMADDEAAAIRYSVKALNFSGRIDFSVFIDGDIRNEDANYDERFWEEVTKEVHPCEAYLTMKILKTAFVVCTAQRIAVALNGEPIDVHCEAVARERFVANDFSIDVAEGQTVTVEKYATNISSMNHREDTLIERAETVLRQVSEKGFDRMREEQGEAWAERWDMNDIAIEGDDLSQQAIRFNIFHLNQTYTGADARLNIGPKGFTGEKYGGSTYWDTEAYCLPFYMLTTGSEVAKNLLRYRYNHLTKAVENAEKLGFSGGAALYPMVTMNGEECHNEWEITFEEIHRNGAIAYAIFNYIRHTGDEGYMKEGGLEVLLAISRFWSQRTHRSPKSGKFVILGVTGPNEYENNVDNNWYTNYIARWTLIYTLEALETTRVDEGFWNDFLTTTGFNETTEVKRWRDIIADMYLPTIEGTGIFMQQDGFLDKEDLTAADIDRAERPINQHWSWDRILRSIFIKQADVLQGMYFFEHHFDKEIIRENFDYYEPRTVHESSLSPCVHSVLASHLGLEDKAYEMYLRTARLDLDDYNNEVAEGLHITSMAGTWMSVVEGFAGKRVRKGVLSLEPRLPKQWTTYKFNIVYRCSVITVTVKHEEVVVTGHSGPELELLVYGQTYTLPTGGEISVKR